MHCVVKGTALVRANWRARKIEMAPVRKRMTTLRIVIVLAFVSIAGITITQIYWVRKAFDIRENQFYRDVHAALGKVANHIFEINKTPQPKDNPVVQVSTNYFIVQVNGPVDASVLEFLLLTEFKNRNITAHPGSFRKLRNGLDFSR